MSSNFITSVSGSKRNFKEQINPDYEIDQKVWFIGADGVTYRAQIIGIRGNYTFEIVVMDTYAHRITVYGEQLVPLKRWDKVRPRK